MTRKFHTTHGNIMHMFPFQKKDAKIYVQSNLS